jgi:hypothetical protein
MAADAKLDVEIRFSSWLQPQPKIRVDPNVRCFSAAARADMDAFLLETFGMVDYAYSIDPTLFDLPGLPRSTRGPVIVLPERLRADFHRYVSERMEEDMANPDYWVDWARAKGLG